MNCCFCSLLLYSTHKHQAHLKPFRCMWFYSFFVVAAVAVGAVSYVICLFLYEMTLFLRTINLFMVACYLFIGILFIILFSECFSIFVCERHLDHFCLFSRPFTKHKIYWHYKTNRLLKVVNQKKIMFFYSTLLAFFLHKIFIFCWKLVLNVIVEFKWPLNYYSMQYIIIPIWNVQTKLL